MFIVGKTTPDKEKLVRVAKECVEEGIKAVKPWTFLGDMADAVNCHAKENGYSIVVAVSYTHLDVYKRQSLYIGMGKM